MAEDAQVLQRVKPLLRDAGLPTEGWSATLLSRRNDVVIHRAITALTAPGRPPLVAKLVLRPTKPDHFEANMRRQIEVAETLPGTPRVHAFDTTGQIALMDFAPGQTLYDCFMERAAVDHGPILNIAGQWVDRFHRASHWEERQFLPRYTLKHLTGLLNRVKQGAFNPAGKPGFVAALEHTIDTAPQPEDCLTIAAINHGDLNLRNILVEGGQATGLDFGPPDLLPVAHDLARLFSHYATLCVKPDGTEQHPLPGVDLGSFFEGYRLIPSDDQTVAFMCKVRVLRDWQTIPKLAKDRSVAQQIRHRGIQALAKQLFV